MVQLKLHLDIVLKKLALKQHLKNHIGAIHEKKASHECSICDYRCTTKVGLKNHIGAIHEGINPQK